MVDVSSVLNEVVEAARYGTVYILKLIAALAVLIIGLYLGRLLGSSISKALDKVGLNNLIRKTIVGEYIEKSGVQLINLSDLIIRWFVYAVALWVVVSYLRISLLSDLLTRAIGYLPALFGGIIILLVGLTAVDFVIDFIKKSTKELRIEYINAVAFAVRVVLYFVIIMMALDKFGVNTAVIYMLMTPITYGIAIGAGIAIGISVGWGLKDAVAKIAEKKLKEKEAK